MSRDRLLVIDADLPNRLAIALGARGRRALSAKSLGLADAKDYELLRHLARRLGSEDWVLVTGDDAMPAEHAQVIYETDATIATIHPKRPAGLSEHHWRVDVVHRWAHAMQGQQPRLVRRYSLSRPAVWTPRQRHARLKVQRGWGAPWAP